MASSSNKPGTHQTRENIPLPARQVPSEWEMNIEELKHWDKVEAAYRSTINNLTAKRDDAKTTLIESIMKGNCVIYFKIQVCL